MMGWPLKRRYNTSSWDDSDDDMIDNIDRIQYTRKVRQPYIHTTMLLLRNYTSTRRLPTYTTRKVDIVLVIPRNTGGGSGSHGDVVIIRCDTRTRRWQS